MPKRTGLTLTPEIIARAYDYLNATEPFIRWNLPDSETLTFKVANAPDLRGWHTFDGERHVIHISRRTIVRTLSLMSTVAHEMIHVQENHNIGCKGRGEHSAAFNKWAEQVCREHGFDPALF